MKQPRLQSSPESLLPSESANTHGNIQCEFFGGAGGENIAMNTQKRQYKAYFLKGIVGAALVLADESAIEHRIAFRETSSNMTVPKIRILPILCKYLKVSGMH